MIKFVSTLSFLFALLLLAGSGILGMLAGGSPQGEPFTPPIVVSMEVFGAGALLASGFLYASIAGQRIAASRPHRIVASVLLMLPIALGAWLLQWSDHPGFRLPALLLAGAAALVLASLVWRRA